jgi:hypothetical protein
MKAMEIESLLYIILGLQITLLLLIVFLAAFVWFRFGRRTADMLEASDRIVDWAANILLPDESDSQGENERITVSHREELVAANAEGYRRIRVTGKLAQELYEALHLCSESNLVRIHSAFKNGPEELRRAVNEIDPEADQLDVIEKFIGPSLVASLAYNYKIDNYYEHGQELSLTRKRKSSGRKSGISFQ